MKGLYLDLDEALMAAGYLRRSMNVPATFSLSVRRLPARRGFLIVSGVADAVGFLDQFCIDDEELEFLGRATGLAAERLAPLRGLQFTGDVWAVPEGRVVLADEPLLEVTAPLAEAQLVETAMLNVVTFATAVASKAARCRVAAGHAQLVDLSMRRAPGLEAAMGVARAAYIAGFDATSNLAAARRFGLRVAGTMAHSYVQAFADERQAFRTFALDHPDDPTFLVDTYDTVGGINAVIAVIRQLGLAGRAGIRLDSGELGALAAQARDLLDAAGLPGVRIMVSGGLDEDRIAALAGRGAPIDAYGVGSRMGVSWDAPSLDSAYKLVAVGDRLVAELSPGKVSLPGAKQVFRDMTATAPDILALRAEPVPPGRRPLLQPVMLGGHRVRKEDPVEETRSARSRFLTDLRWLPTASRSVADPVAPTALLSPVLTRAREETLARLRRGTDGTPWR